MIIKNITEENKKLNNIIKEQKLEIAKIKRINKKSINDLESWNQDYEKLFKE